MFETSNQPDTAKTNVQSVRFFYFLKKKSFFRTVWWMSNLGCCKFFFVKWKLYVSINQLFHLVDFTTFNPIKKIFQDRDLSGHNFY